MLLRCPCHGLPLYSPSTLLPHHPCGSLRTSLLDEETRMPTSKKPTVADLAHQVRMLEEEVEHPGKTVRELNADLYSFSVIMVKFLESPKVKEAFGKDEISAATNGTRQ